jgi:hypothetical protein
MKRVDKLTYERLVELVNYDPVSGIFTWKKVTNRSIVPNTECKGSIVGGYKVIGIDGVKYYLARLAWMYMTKSFPEKGLVIDHINGDKTDNSFKNLRSCSQQLNCMNRRKPSVRNKSGFLGVTFHKRCGLYQAQIHVNGKRISLKYYPTAEEAHDVYLKAKSELHKGAIL